MRNDHLITRLYTEHLTPLRLRDTLRDTAYPLPFVSELPSLSLFSTLSPASELIIGGTTREREPSRCNSDMLWNSNMWLWRHFGGELIFTHAGDGTAVMMKLKSQWNLREGVHQLNTYCVTYQTRVLTCGSGQTTDLMTVRIDCRSFWHSQHSKIVKRWTRRAVAVKPRTLRGGCDGRPEVSELLAVCVSCGGYSRIFGFMGSGIVSGLFMFFCELRSGTFSHHFAQNVEHWLQF